jgi:hypothetical protein
MDRRCRIVVCCCKTLFINKAVSCKQAVHKVLPTLNTDENSSLKLKQLTNPQQLAKSLLFFFRCVIPYLASLTVANRTKKSQRA